jgi:hypothetical protein
MNPSGSVDFLQCGKRATGRLRIESDTSAINEYRILNGEVQFRVLDPSGHRYLGAASGWRINSCKKAPVLHLT